MGAINWNTTDREYDTISMIARRAKKLDPGIDPTTMAMDITATHLNGTPLDLERFAAFDDFNFRHDVYGIIRHIDRRDGKIKGGFLPRCSKINQ